MTQSPGKRNHSRFATRAGLSNNKDNYAKQQAAPAVAVNFQQQVQLQKARARERDER